MNRYDKVVALCNERGISIRYLEQALGFSNGYIKKLKDSEPNGFALLKLAKFFGVEPIYFYEDEDKEVIEDIEKALKDSDLTHTLELDKAIKGYMVKAFVNKMKNDPDIEDVRGIESEYYNDPQAVEIAQSIFERPELRVLFDATKNVSKEDIEKFTKMIKGLQNE